jgi:hypothetical protein
MIMLHTAGFGYEFFSDPYRRLIRECEVPSIATSTYASLRQPMLFEPGSAWDMASAFHSRSVRRWQGSYLPGWVSSSLCIRWSPLILSNFSKLVG